ncbi:MAG: hypothetical protein CL609_08175 [Anaerolineaceae bacterium]|nr:hypothetical protein [Anaerolineaceae bacterium]
MKSTSFIDPLKIRYSKENKLGTFIGAIPFFLFPLTSVIAFIFFSTGSLSDSAGEQITSLIVSFYFLIYFVIYVLGWLRGFPRWWFAYILFILLFSVYLMNTSTPGLVLFGFSTGKEVWGWRALLPVGIITLLAILLSFSRQPFKILWKTIWHDPSRLSFAFYALLPFLNFIIFDEVNSSYELPFHIAATTIFTIGAVLYLRQTEPWKRLLILYVSNLIVWLVSTAALTYYWTGRQEFWMRSPATAKDQITGMLIYLAFISICLLAPPLIFDFVRNMRKKDPLPSI